MTDLLAHLNPAQRQAVEHLGSPLMIIAGAGTGKTRVITHRIAFLNRECGIPLNQIMAVTFTNKAAREMRERICRLLGVYDSPGLPIGTFHSRCAMILRREAAGAGLDQNFAILDENDQKQAIKKVMKELEISEKRARPGQVQSFINQAKMRLLTPQDCKEEMSEDEVPYAEIYDAYQKTLDKCKSVDFEDLIMKTVVLFQDEEEIRKRWAARYQYLLVDEYQDTNHGQFLLTQLLAKDHEQVCVVGDEDQSIYSWRGAEISNLLDFEKTFPGTTIVKLEQNYRSTGNVLKAASTLIAHNKQRIGKVLFTEIGDGEPLSFHSFPGQEAEADWIARQCLSMIHQEGVSADEIAIFYRGHWLSRSIEDGMRKYRIPYQVVGGMRFYDRGEIKDLLSYMRLAVNPEDDLAFERVVNRPTRGIGPKALSTITNKAAALGTSLYHAGHACLDEGLMKGKARAGLQHFLTSLEAWTALEEKGTADEILKNILKDTNYKDEGVGDVDSIEAASRLENIEEMEGMLEEFTPVGEHDALAEFLSTMALDATETRKDNEPKVSLLTIHNAKGLEFDYVFTIGLEKGVFPTSRAEESYEEFAIEEERRLFYVAITRAKKKLHLTYSMRRNRPDYWYNTPSIFLSELTPDVYDKDSIAQLRKLLPYGWGSKHGIGGSRKENIHYEMDEKPADPRGIGRRRFAAASASTSPKPKFKEGMRVVHKYMGAGVIEKIGGRAGWERAQVEFDDGRSQEFVLKYAPLTLEE